jgi:hypothetical protein
MDLEKERAAARAAGLPLTPADFPLPQYPPSQDATPDWTALGPQLTAAGDSPAWQAVDDAEVDGVPPASSNAALFRLISAERKTLDRLHVAANKPGRSLDRGWGPDVLFPEFARMREAAKLLRLESLAMARQGHPVEAIRNQALGFRIAKQADEDPILIGYLVGVAIENISLSGMGDIVRENPTPAVAAAIHSAIAQGAPKYDIVRDLKGEALGSLTAIHMIGSPAAARMLSGDSSNYDPAVLKRRPSAFMRFALQEPGEAVYLHYMTKQIQAATLPRGQRERALEALAKEQSFSARRGPAYILPSALLPAFSRAYQHGDEALARRVVLMAGADVLAYRTVHGAFPDALTQAAASAREPFTGKPLGYRRTKDGFVVYSVIAGAQFDGRPGKDAKGQVYFSYPIASLNPMLMRPRPLPRRRLMPAGKMPTPAPMPGGPPIPAAP